MSSSGVDCSCDMACEEGMINGCLSYFILVFPMCLINIFYDFYRIVIVVDIICQTFFKE